MSISGKKLNSKLTGRYCPNCGKEIDKDAKFCPYCGVSLSGEIRRSERNRKKYSPNLTKCPECKKEVSTSATRCPHCGARLILSNIFCKLNGPSLLFK